MGVKTRIPLFPLGVVLVPQMDLPLHIFEERYKTMINECLDEDRVFGVVLYEGSGFRRVGSTARVVQVLKRYEDGRMDILTKGEKRFSIHEVHEDKPYLEAEVEYFDDEPEDATPEMEEMAGKGVDLLNQVSEMGDQPERYTLGEEWDPTRVSYTIAASRSFEPSERQEFIEMTSTSQRLEKGVQALEKTLERIRLTEEIKKIIDGNGKVPHRLKESPKE